MQIRLYRPDIDGLRALAVLPVVFYHGNASAFSGGFVGVDVFFVVSGFLITRILMRHIEADEDFSIALFYERRVRLFTCSLPAPGNWRWVEQPVRRQEGVLSRGRLFTASACLTGVLLVIAASLLASDGLRGRFEDQELQLLAEAGQRPKDRLGCLNPTVSQVANGELCAVGEATAEGPAFILWGDSHAEAVREAIDQASREAGVWGYFAFYVSCPPLLGVENRLKPPNHTCAAFNQAMLQKVRELGVSWA